jgi:hypothetical protein
MTPLHNEGISIPQTGQPTKQAQEKTSHEDSVADDVGQKVLHTGNGSPSALHEHTTLSKISPPQGNNSTFEEGAVNEIASHCHDHKTSEVPTKSKLEELNDKKEALESKIGKQEQFIDKLRTFALNKTNLIQKKNDLITVGNLRVALEKDKNELKDIDGKIALLNKYNKEEDSQDWDADLEDINDQLAGKTNESEIVDTNFTDAVNESFHTAEKEKNVNKELGVSSSQVETSPPEQTLGEQLSSFVDDVAGGISSWMSAMFSSTPEVSGAEVSPKKEEMMQKQDEIKEDIQSMKGNIEILQNSTGNGEEIGETIKEEAESISTKFFSFCEDVMSSAVDHATQLVKDFDNILDQISPEPASKTSDSTVTQKPIKEEISALESYFESLKDEVDNIKENKVKLVDINISQTVNRVRTSSASVNKMIQNEIPNSALSSDAAARLQRQSTETDQALQLEMNQFDLEGQINDIMKEYTSELNRLSENILTEDNPNSLSENIHLETNIAPKKFNSPSESSLPEASIVPKKSFFGKMRNFSHSVTNYVDNMISAQNRPLAEKTKPTLSQKISKKIYDKDMRMRSAVENRTETKEPKELATLRNEYDAHKLSMDVNISALENWLTEAQTEEEINDLQVILKIQMDYNRDQKIIFLETILKKEQETQRPELKSDNYVAHEKIKDALLFSTLADISVKDLDKGISYLQARFDKKSDNKYLSELIVYYKEIRDIKNQHQA